MRQVPVSGGRHSVAVACLPGDIKFPVGLFANGAAVAADGAYIGNLIYKAKKDQDAQAAGASKQSRRSKESGKEQRASDGRRGNSKSPKAPPFQALPGCSSVAALANVTSHLRETVGFDEAGG